MKKQFTLVAVFVSSFIFAQTQFDQGMQKALTFWKEGKPTEATALFERIASAEKDSWLPNYYIALVNTTQAFQTKNKEKITNLLTKAQATLDIELIKNPNNPELLVMQAMIHTCWVAFDPMTNGMTLSGKIMELYTKAEAIAPENPRAVFGKAEYAIGGAKWTGADVKQLCKEVERSLILFANFKPETPFSPNWGAERAQDALKNCK